MTLADYIRQRLDEVNYSRNTATDVHTKNQMWARAEELKQLAKALNVKLGAK